MKSVKNYIILFHLICHVSLYAQACKCVIDLSQTCVDTIPVSVIVEASNLDTILSEISETQEFLCSKIEALSLADFPCAPTQITSTTAQTISTSGVYQVCSDMSGSITIDTNNVTLDLNNRVIEQGIEITSGRSNITIFNGTVRGTLDGIKVNPGCSDITISHVNAENATRGIFFESASNCTVENCDLIANTTGLFAQESHGITVQKTNAKENTHAGFEFMQSYTNCVVESKALSTGAGNTNAFDNNVFGFVSNNGFGNIFERCIANATQALSTTDSNSLIAGFALRGSEHCSKIIDSESANAKTSSAGVTVPFGIVLTGTLGETQVIAGAIDASLSSVSTVFWSPDGQYVAIGGNGLTGNDFQIFQFDRSSQALTVITGALGTAGSVGTVSWSPDGQYIAVGGDLSGGNDFQIFQFDRSSQTLQFVDGELGTAGSVGTVSWSPDGQYIAVGGGGLSGDNELQLFQFDRTSQTLQFIAGALGTAGSVFSVSWSPEGQYIAIVGDDLTGGTGNEFQILKFDRTGQTLTAVAGALNTGVTPNVRSVSWSPDGHYIAVGQSRLNPPGDDFQIFQFDRSTQTLQFITSAIEVSGGLTGGIFGLSWSPDGQYVAVSGVGLSGGSNFQIFQFDRSTQTLQFVAGAILAGVDISVSWSPDGQYIAVGRNDQDPGNNEFLILSGIQFPMKNVITNNTVYCNGNDLTITLTTGQTFASAGGVGISGSSIANMIIGNTAYNNPSTSSQPSQASAGTAGQASSNYVFVTNVFNPLFGQAPSALQNISLDACQAQCMPGDLGLLVQQARFQASSVLSIVDALQTFTTQASSLIDQFLCSPTAITNANTTISQSGIYCVGEPITGMITIAASNVDLDLNNYRIAQGIVVSGAQSTITIKNGTVENDAASDGISVDPGSSEITISNVIIRGAQRGLYFNTVSNSQVNYCSLVQNTTGMQLEDSHNVVVENTYADQNVHAGFDLIASFTNCFSDCKALATGFSNDVAFNNTVAGFVSNNGFGNIFERCIANATQALSTTDSNSLIAGFALRGSEHCTKIIDSESANAKTSNAGVTVPYGIVLEGTLDQINTLTGYDYNTDAQTVSWSPDQIVLAVGLAAGPDDELRIVTFDSAGNTTMEVASQSIGSSVSAVTWGPGNVRYLAVGTEEALQVYIYDSVNTSLTLEDMASIAAMTNAIDWASDGRYIAVATDTGTNELRVYSYNSVANSLALSASISLAANANTVSWLPNDELLAVGSDTGAGNELRLYTFDRATQSLTLADSVSISGDVNGVDFSFDGYYLAVGTSTALQVYSFNHETTSLTQEATALGASVDVAWSADGNYIVSSGTAVNVYEFNRSDKSLTLRDSIGDTPNESRWSPDGAFIASVGPNPNTLQELTIFSGIQFPMKNVITNNTVYCNGHEVNALFTGATGVGISGSSVANMIIANTAYNNPPSSQNLIVGSNYNFVTNVFNPLFGQAPSALQNISLNGCDPIAVPVDLALLVKQNLYKASVIECLIDQLDPLLESKVDVLLSCTQSSQSSAGTISESGSYCVTQNIAGTITIAANDVYLDLSNRTITGGVVINSGVDQVAITNGIIDADGGVGVQANANSSNITLSHLTIKNGTDGINLDAVHDATIAQCSLVANEQGISITNSYNVDVEQSIAQNNTNRGFSLITSSTCCFLDCKALSTGITNTSLFGTDSNVYGFVADQCYGTIFERCIANATQNLSATSYDTVVAGFALLGTGTQCNKIIGCEAANAQSNADGFTIPYGIFIEGQIGSVETLVSFLDGTVGSVAFSPDGNYVAIGGAIITQGTGNELQIFKFDRTTNSLTVVAGALNPPVIVNAVSWSPNGQYLAVGLSLLASGNELQIFRFDQTNNSLKAVAGALGTTGDTQAVSWSPDGQYVAVGGNDITGDDFQIFRIDSISNSLTAVAGALGSTGAGVLSVSWSPDGQYVAVGGNAITGGTGDEFQIFSFDRSTNSLIAVAGALSGTIRSVSWASDGTYVATGGDGITGGTENTVQIFQFDAATTSLTDVVGTFTTEVFSVTWSNDGRSIATGSPDTTDRLQIFSFDRGTNSLTFVDQAISSGSILSVSWSLDGGYISIGGSGLGVNSFAVLSAIDFSSHNTITQNNVYCNSNGSQGVGISGSSVCNAIIQNNSYNNPFNYVFVQNVFSAIATDEPTLLQNLGLVGCVPIEQPDDIVRRLKRSELLAQSLVDNLL